MDFILLVGVFCCFLAIGVFIYLSYRNRKVFFENLISFCNHLLIEISFSKNQIESIINRYSGNYSKEFRHVLESYRDLITTKSDISHENLKSIMWMKLKPHESSEISKFFYELGRHGSHEEEEKLRNQIEIFKTFLTSSTNALRKEASIYLKLFIIMGIASVILMF